MSKAALHIGFLREEATNAVIAQVSNDLQLDCRAFSQLTGHLNFCDSSTLPEALCFEKLGIVLYRPTTPLSAENPVFSDAFIEPRFLEFAAPRVKFESAVSAFESLEVSWGLSETGVLACEQDGKGIRVCLIDSGISRHPDITLRDENCRSFTSDISTADSLGHGTFNAGIIAGSRNPERGPRYGVAPEVELFNARVFSSSAATCTSSMLAAIEWALLKECDIASMSIGQQISAGSSVHAYMAEAARRALKKGMLIIAGSGNDSDREANPPRVKPVSYPANCAGIMAVGAVDSNLKVWKKSNGSVNGSSGFVDLVAPGVKVRSAGLNEGYLTTNGTSVATPYVAGIAALYAQRCNVRGQLLWDLLLEKVLPLPGQHVDDVGVGLIHAPRSADSRACAPR